MKEFPSNEGIKERYPPSP